MDELHRSAAEIEHEAVAERRRVDRGEIAVTRLSTAAEDADRHAEVAARVLEKRLAVVRVADGARGQSIDLPLGKPVRPQEMGEHVERRKRALHGPIAEPSATGQALADADGLIDLIGALPPALAGHEHDQPERV